MNMYYVKGTAPMFAEYGALKETHVNSESSKSAGRKPRSYDPVGMWYWKLQVFASDTMTDGEDDNIVSCAHVFSREKMNFPLHASHHWQERCS